MSEQKRPSLSDKEVIATEPPRVDPRRATGGGLGQTAGGGSQAPAPGPGDVTLTAPRNITIVEQVEVPQDDGSVLIDVIFEFDAVAGALGYGGRVAIDR